MRARAASAVALAFSAVFSASSFAFARVSRAVSPRGFIIFLHQGFVIGRIGRLIMDVRPQPRSEEHTSELQSLMRISYAVFCLKKKKKVTNKHSHKTNSNKCESNY